MHRITNNQAINSDPPSIAHSLSRLKDRVSTGGKQTGSVLERFAGSFPNVTVQSGFLPCFDEVERIFSSVPVESRIVLGRDLIDQATKRERIFESLRAEVAGLLNLGGRSKLLNIDANKVIRSVAGQTEELRYIETHLAADGDVLAVASMALENGVAEVGRLFRKLAGFEDATPAPWRFEAVVRHAAARIVADPAGSSPLNMDAGFETDWVPDSDLFVLMASRFLNRMEPLVQQLSGGVNLRPTPNGVYFEIRGDGAAAVADDDAERFMTLGGASRRSANLWLAGNAG